MPTCRSPRSQPFMTSSECFELHKKLYQSFLDKTQNTKVYCSIDYDDRMIAKKYGARWCPDKKSWYFIDNKKLSDCMSKLVYTLVD